jgi:DNA-binding NtrC family response regulator
MPTALTGNTVFVGDETSLFASAKEALVATGREIALARTKARLDEFLTTRNIKLVIVDVSEDHENRRKIIDEIRSNRPWLSFLAITDYPHRGTSFYEVLAYNYYCISRGIDGTITVEQFKKAIAKIDEANAARVRRIVLAVAFAALIAGLAVMSKTRIVTFLGVFWLLILGLEFAYCAIHFQLQRQPNERQ